MPEDMLADDVLAAELRALGRELDLPPAPDPAATAAGVRARLTAARQPDAMRWLRYAAAAVLVAFAVLVVGSAQVRAAIVEFLRFGGVVVEQGSAPASTPLPPAVPPVPGTPVAGVAAAQQQVPFAVRVPAELGTPDEVTVTDGRVVSLVYRAAGARLDQFDGTLDVAFAKTVPDQSSLRWTQVGGDTALWLRGPHELAYVDRDGARHTDDATTAGDTLVWQHGSVTYRLEGPFGIDRAIAIAESLS